MRKKGDLRQAAATAFTSTFTFDVSRIFNKSCNEPSVFDVMLISKETRGTGVTITV